MIDVLTPFGLSVVYLTTDAMPSTWKIRSRTARTSTAITSSLLRSGSIESIRGAGVGPCAGCHNARLRTLLRFEC